MRMCSRKAEGLRGSTHRAVQGHESEHMQRPGHTRKCAKGQVRAQELMQSKEVHEIKQDRGRAQGKAASTWQRDNMRQSERGLETKEKNHRISQVGRDP